jgi:hypothetical protein
MNNLCGKPGSEAMTEKMLAKLKLWAQKHGDKEILNKM